MDPEPQEVKPEDYTGDALKIVGKVFGAALILGSAITLALILGGPVGGCIAASVCGLALCLGGGRSGLSGHPTQNPGQRRGAQATQAEPQARGRTFEIKDGETPFQAAERLRGGSASEAHNRSHFLRSHRG